jgi:hypothetical protein
MAMQHSISRLNRRLIGDVLTNPGKGRGFRASRISFLIANGHLPPLEACHVCDMPKCVRHDHIVNATHEQNMKMREIKTFDHVPAFAIKILKHWHDRGVSLQDLACAANMKPRIVAAVLGLSAGQWPRETARQQLHRDLATD